MYKLNILEVRSYKYVRLHLTTAILFLKKVRANTRENGRRAAAQRLAVLVRVCMAWQRRRCICVRERFVCTTAAGLETGAPTMTPTHLSYL